jgi:hypothetical protein
MSQRLEDIAGIGPKKAAALRAVGIKTISELANATNMSLVSVPYGVTLRQRAKELLSKMNLNDDKPEKYEEDSKLVKITPFMPPSVPKFIKENKNIENIHTKDKGGHYDDTDEEDEDDGEDENNVTFLIPSHSWMNEVVQIPRKNEDGQYKCYPGVIYELSLEPTNRISFVCTWIADTNEEECNERVCSKTFSPLFILMFNPNLPLFNISIHPDDIKHLQPKIEVLKNSLLEIMIIQSTFQHY